ncbi:MFS transporter [Paenibacillus pasadenensis]|uniref:CynX/NimT family MFS transporter n=1 Tax=Paenibacillus pasadenensis TaxID=217090 RepID=UPI0020420A13|nr:MFS transporter [Paenibacillus pasadenensis]MCM3746487.1 MFS transporter [Paenibacillus pasadenensis]
MNSLPDPSRNQRSIWLVAIGFLLIAANMRAAITSVGPLIDKISGVYNLSSELSGLLTSLPLLAFAVMSLLAPKIAERFGPERSILYSLILLLIGMFVRAVPGTAALFTGTALIGLAIAISNVLLPSLIKRDFPNQIGLLTGSYSVTMSVFAAIASGVAVPMASLPGWDWSRSLLVWSALGFIALAVWLPHSLRAKPAAASGSRGSFAAMFRSPLAWSITFYMGLQSMTFYVTVAWLPSMFHERGFSPESGGLMLSIMQLVSLPTSFFIPLLASRMRSQVPLVIAAGATAIAGYCGMIWGPNSLSLLWIALIGLSQGATISLALTLFGLRTRNSQEAARLSGMAQSIGYLLAALGPVLLGSLHDAAQSWSPVLAVLLAVSVIVLSLGLKAGRDSYVSEDNSDQTAKTTAPVR